MGIPTILGRPLTGLRTQAEFIQHEYIQYYYSVLDSHSPVHNPNDKQQIFCRQAVKETVKESNTITGSGKAYKTT